MRTVDVLVVGAGITGCATAHELAGRGAGQVAIAERGHAAMGPTTGRSSGVVRQFYTHPVLVGMARQGRNTYAEFATRVGGSAGFVQTGWLLAVTEHSRATAEHGLHLEREAGVPSRMIGPGDVGALAPGVETADLVGAVYEQDAGYADPAGAAQGYLDAARRYGVTYLPEHPVTALRLSGERIIGVDTNHGPIEAGVVVLAAGPWSVPLMASIGYQLPITASRHPIVALSEPARPARAVVSDPANLVYLRPEGNELTLVGSNDPGDAADLVDPDSCPASVPADKVEHMLAAASRRLPAFAEAGIAGHWSGVYDVADDGFPVLGPLPGLEGLLLACGMSGHGFKLAPAIAELLTRAVLGERDGRLQLFRPQRFTEGQPIASVTTSSLTTMRHERTGSSR